MYKALILRSVQGEQFYDVPQGEDDLHHATVEQAAEHLLTTHKVTPNYGHGMVTDMHGKCVTHV